MVKIKEEEAPVVIKGTPDPNNSGFHELGRKSGSSRIITPEDNKGNKPKPPEVKRKPFEDFDNVKLQRLASISGRSIGTLAAVHGGDLAWGNLNLINVETNEQITVRSDGRVPEGLWVPVNHLPEEYLNSLDDDEE